MVLAKKAHAPIKQSTMQTTALSNVLAMGLQCQ